MSRIVKALERSKVARGALRKKERGVSPGEYDETPAEEARDAQSLASFRLNVANVDSELHRKSRVISDVDRDGAKSAYNVLRTRLLHRMRANNWKRLAISSAGSGDGKTTTSINLAISLARRGQQRVVLLDFDLQKPKIAAYLGLEDVDKFLVDFVEHGVSPQEVLHRTSIENLWVVPNNESIKNSSEVLASTSIAELVNWIGSVDQNCIMIFDLPPLLVSDDVLSVAHLFDALLLVVSEGRTAREDVKNTLELIEDYKIELLGTVLNKSSDRTARYDYYQ